MLFRPTYLYIKQHSITGKLYFGKTSLSESKLLKYHGSGKHWLTHIKKHGISYVITLWFQLYHTPFDIVADALSMSKSLNIVNSKSWLNLIPETGLDGSIQYNNLSNKNKPQNTFGVPKSKSHTAKKLKSYMITSPLNIIYIIHGLDKFCIEYNLNTGRMSQVAGKKENHYKGWLCEKLTLAPF